MRARLKLTPRLSPWSSAVARSVEGGGAAPAASNAAAAASTGQVPKSKMSTAEVPRTLVVFQTAQRHVKADCARLVVTIKRYGMQVLLSLCDRHSFQDQADGERGA